MNTKDFGDKSRTSSSHMIKQQNNVFRGAFNDVEEVNEGRVLCVVGVTLM